MMDEPIMIAYGPCISCGTVFSFDPELVTSTSVHPVTRCPIRPDGTHVNPGDSDTVREPLCTPCAHRHRAAGGRSRPVRELFPHARLDLIEAAP
jgi:hypothetical protein